MAHAVSAAADVAFLSVPRFCSAAGNFTAVWRDLAGFDDATTALMASKSRAAQEKLAQLEKDSAPFADQLVETVKFIGSTLDHIGTYEVEEEDAAKKTNAPTFHGREEWLLRWLLKKLQSPKDDVPRKSPTAWRLLCHTLKALPVVAAARILQERKFVSILRQTLEDAKAVESSSVKEGNRPSSDSSQDETSFKLSKKRKRSGELVYNAKDDAGLEELLSAIFSVISYIQLSAEPNTSALDDGRGAEFSVEAMRSTLRTSAEEAAKIAGLWFYLSTKLLNRTDFGQLGRRTWLSRFITIWGLHNTGTEDLMQFSLYASQDLISLLRTAKLAHRGRTDWVSASEELIARNIMIPAKAANAADPESDLIGTLTRVSVIMDSANASLLFEIAIRSIQPHGTRRRRPEDDAWLQKVFNTLVDAMPPKRHEKNSDAIQDMLQSAITYKVGLELPILRAVTSKYALSEGTTNWGLVNTIILLDANVFFIKDDEKDLLQDLLTRVTAASVDPSWDEISRQVVTDVVLPLMSESANARDLSGFVRHWYTELVEIERLRKENGSSISILSAWEDDDLQTQLAKLFEPSLTLRQITELLDFFEEEVEKAPDAVCVLVEAISGAITREDVVDAVQLRLYHIVFDNRRSKKLGKRYRWRSWRILSNTLSWATNSQIEELAAFWEEGKKPFDKFSGKSSAKGLLELDDGASAGLDPLEMLRAACAAWDRAEEWSPLRKLAKSTLLNFLKGLASDVKKLLRDLDSEKELGKQICGAKQNTQLREAGWMMWSFARMVFVEYPKALELALELPDDKCRELLQKVFWIASASLKGASKRDFNPWLHNNPDAFPHLWELALLNPVIQNNEPLMEQMIDIMLLNESNINNPLIKSSESNTFAVRALLKVPLHLFSRKDRKNIRQGWLQSQPSKDKKKSSKTDNTSSLSYKITALDPMVLALKVKIMQLPTSYEGMKFHDLVHIAEALAHPKARIDNPRVNLAEFKKFAELSMMHMSTNLDQAGSREYVSDAIAYLTDQADNGETGGNFATIALVQAVLSALSAREEAIYAINIMTSGSLKRTKGSFTDSLIDQMREGLKKERYNDETGNLKLLSIIDALSILGVDGQKLTPLIDEVNSFLGSLTKEQSEVASRLENFISVHARDEDGELDDSGLKGDTSTIYGRQGILDKAKALISGKDQDDKLELLRELFGEDLAGLSQLDILLAAKYIISTCRDARRTIDDGDDAFDLSGVYSLLCEQLRKVTSFRQFLLIAEIMEMMLRTKGRALSQWNIDSTLGSITILCSRNGPALRSTRAGSIYLRLCHLLQAILTDHRLKLQGHFHLVVQSMQPLLRCLFVPLPHITARSAKLYASPPWLSSTQHQLGAVHATAFTRLVTSICDPSVSSVTRSRHNSLTSATDKAKRMASQHMQFVLMTYIKLQLEMKMRLDVKEKMVPGLYAIFDTTTPELRKMISESLDASGRAVFGSLYRDYAKFGKWKGS